jgi:hypothetical protein
MCSFCSWSCKTYFLLKFSMHFIHWNSCWYIPSPWHTGSWKWMTGNITPVFVVCMNTCNAFLGVFELTHFEQTLKSKGKFVNSQNLKFYCFHISIFKATRLCLEAFSKLPFYLSICLSVYLSVTISESQIREVWLENKFRMFWNDPEHYLESIIKA